MESFISQLTQAVNDLVIDLISRQINAVADSIVNMPEMKEKGISKEQIISQWNTSCDLRVEAKGELISSEKKRSQTDSSVRCKVPKTKGPQNGQPCGRACVKGGDMCSDHTKRLGKPKEEKKESKEEEPKKSGCQHELISGAHKGEHCGKAISKDSELYCSTHKSKH